MILFMQDWNRWLSGSLICLHFFSLPLFKLNDISLIYCTWFTFCTILHCKNLQFNENEVTGTLPRYLHIKHLKNITQQWCLLLLLLSVTFSTLLFIHTKDWMVFLLFAPNTTASRVAISTCKKCEISWNRSFHIGFLKMKWFGHSAVLEFLKIFFTF